jgi:hypothetical protein
MVLHFVTEETHILLVTVANWWLRPRQVHIQRVTARSNNQLAVLPLRLTERLSVGTLRHSS